MATVDDGGPAFPHHEDCYDDDYEKHLRETTADGVTIRDYFAAKAIQLFSIERDEMEKVLEGRLPRHDRVARFCYGLADAMLKERNK